MLRFTCALFLKQVFHYRIINCNETKAKHVTRVPRIINQWNTRCGTVTCWFKFGPSALRWWEKGVVGIIGKGTSRSFVSPWVSDCHALVEGGTSVRRGSLLFKWPFHYCNSTCLLDPVQYLHWSSISRPAVDSFILYG